MDGRILDDDGVLAAGTLELVVVVGLAQDLAVLVPLHLRLLGGDLDLHLDRVPLLDLNILKSFNELDCFWKKKLYTPFQQ